METEINNTVIYTLEKVNNKVEIGKLKIEEQLTAPINGLVRLCEDNNSTFEDIINYISKTSDLEKLRGYYNYCEHLQSPYQGFSVDNL